ncbi:MAG TPA: chemotaxis protein CheW [Nostocaceae cyanobacterium]|nr:chemotaxis protein CheW [Nostocaceae cyanobacterium]
MSSVITLNAKNQGNVTRQFLVYSQDASSFAVDLMMVREVLAPMEQLISPVPNTPNFLLGLMNLRGEILAVADFGQFIHLSPTDLNHSDSRILVLETTNPQNPRALPLCLGLAVSKVQGVLSLYPDLVISAVEVSAELVPYLQGLYDCDGRLLMILDVEAISQAECW